MRLSSVKLLSLAMVVAALGFVGVAATNVRADGCPASYCQPVGPHGCVAPGWCENRPWGSLRCLSGANGGHYEGFMGRYCGQ
jgi:hypothetical protein